MPPRFSLNTNLTFCVNAPLEFQDFQLAISTNVHVGTLNSKYLGKKKS
jgi:hypothetical protein